MPSRIEKTVEVCRSTRANVQLALLMCLTIGLPLGASWLSNRAETRLNALLTEGSQSSARITKWGITRSGGYRYSYCFEVDGETYTSSTTIDKAYNDWDRLPILYQPSDPSNHIVGSSITQDDIQVRLLPYKAVMILGPLAACLALWLEIKVHRQLSLARSGKFINGAVADFYLKSKGRQFRINYQFTTPEGITAAGSASVGRGQAAHLLPRGPIPILYLPARPQRNMLVDTMWAVNWEQDSTPDGKRAA